MNLAQRGGVAFAALAAATALLLTAGIGSASAAEATTCPTFRVLHNDRIGAANLPAGTYEVTPASGSGLTCPQASALFTRFLEDYDGVLPGGWRVNPQGTGKATFTRSGGPGFSVARTRGEEEENNPELGRLCPGSYTVNHTSIVGPLRFTQGKFLIYIPARSLISCRRASVLFTRFLGQPGGRLPFPWRLVNQTATFYKPAHPLRSAFRIEPLSGT
ncbi:MAG TPA: hypothetical protein VMS11_01290 [Solirubrobacterales bacterium]|nr:hypothetical protein [Solirubrobacterales bacterium]